MRGVCVCARFVQKHPKKVFHPRSSRLRREGACGMIWITQVYGLPYSGTLWSCASLLGLLLARTTSTQRLVRRPNEARSALFQSHVTQNPAGCEPAARPSAVPLARPRCARNARPLSLRIQCAYHIRRRCGAAKKRSQVLCLVSEQTAFLLPG